MGEVEHRKQFVGVTGDEEAEPADGAEPQVRDKEPRMEGASRAEPEACPHGDADERGQNEAGQGAGGAEGDRVPLAGAKQRAGQVPRKEGDATRRQCAERRDRRRGKGAEREHEPHRAEGIHGVVHIRERAGAGRLRPWPSSSPIREREGARPPNRRAIEDGHRASRIRRRGLGGGRRQTAPDRCSGTKTGCETTGSPVRPAPAVKRRERGRCG